LALNGVNFSIWSTISERKMNRLVLHLLSLGWIFCLIQYISWISEGHRCREHLLKFIPPLRIGSNGIMP
jgi:hypothetical protein